MRRGADGGSTGGVHARAGDRPSGNPKHETIYVYTYIHTYSFMFIYTNMYIYIYIYIYICLYVYTNFDSRSPPKPGRMEEARAVYARVLEIPPQVNT